MSKRSELKDKLRALNIPIPTDWTTPELMALLPEPKPRKPKTPSTIISETS
jgi:hypothetical protein